MSFKLYLETIDENLSLYSYLSKPPRYIRFVPVLYSAWAQWAMNQKNPSEAGVRLKPMGEKIAPDWVKYEFKGLEEFYQHYIYLTTEVEE